MRTGNCNVRAFAVALSFLITLASGLVEPAGRRGFDHLQRSGLQRVLRRAQQQR